MTTSPRNAIRVILAIGMLQTLQPFSVDPYLPSMSHIASGLGVSVNTIQLSLSALTLGLAIGGILAGPLSDAVGRKRPLYVAAALHIAASLLVAFSPNIVFFMIGRSLQGVAGAALTVVSVAVLRDMYEGLSLIKASGRVNLMGASSWFIGPLAGSVLLQFFDWRGVTLCLVGVAVVALVLARGLPETHAADARNSHVFKGMAGRFLKVLGDRGYRGFVVIQVAIGVTMFGYLGIAPTLFDHTYGVHAETVGLFLCANSVAAYLGVQVGSKLAFRVSAAWLVTTSIALAVADGILLFAIGPMKPSVWLVAGGMMAWTFIFGTTITPVQALSMQAHGPEAGTAAALLSTLSFAATAIAGPYFTSLEKFTTAGIGMNMMIAMGVGLLAMLILVRPWSVSKLK